METKSGNMRDNQYPNPLVTALLFSNAGNWIYGLSIPDPKCLGPECVLDLRSFQILEA